ncbi:MAG: ribonuclease III domain-containing protein [Clostridiales bacterium]|nr:ribonuclease III domain-containing protein [Clostridiales bacterium]
MIDLGIEFEKKPNEYNSLVLAYIGDTLYDLYVRSRNIAQHPGMDANKLHRTAIKFVCAHGQSEAVKYIEEHLTEQELAAYKRGRNTKSYTVPKNADVGEYRRATGFEALLGWLYVGGQTERLEELARMSYDAILKAQNN